MHNIPLTDLERIGLEKHRLPIGHPSQLADCFRLGIKWAIEHHENSDKKELIQSLKLALSHIDVGIVQCHGDKCRLPNCISCCDEKCAQEYVDSVTNMVIDAYDLLKRVL